MRDTITDPNRAVVPTAKVTLNKKSTNTSSTQMTSASGTFEFTNLLTGDDYSVSIEATSFKNLLLTDVKVSLNQATDLSAQLAPGTVTESVTVTAGGRYYNVKSVAELQLPSGERTWPNRGRRIWCK